MLIVNLYGRLGADPVSRLTKSGRTMTTASIAVDVAARDAEEPATLWVNVIAFSLQAEVLLRASRGEMVAVIGRMTRGTYTSKTGDVRENWTAIADSVVTAKSAKPGRPRPERTSKTDPSDPNHVDHADRAGPLNPAPFDDGLPF